jgi:A/G-specific adenine glycosylase
MPEVDLEPAVAESLKTFRRSVRGASVQLRRELPWIGLDDPWAIFVSEVMLQQTSTSRVIDPWRRFLEAYPTPTQCARAPLADVLRLWSGLGYPRRAKSLHEAAKFMVQRHDGEVPSSRVELLALPGVGPYTANAVASFAFDEHVAVLDTNVGRVLARALANRALNSREAQALAQRLLPRERSASFNQALLDLGAQFCTRTPRCVRCPVASACRWRREGGDDPAPGSAGVSRPQARFVGSDRQVRGRVLKALATGPAGIAELESHLGDVDFSRVTRIVDDLNREGLITSLAGRIALVGD